MIVKPKIIYRLLKAIVDFIIAILFSFVIDRFISFNIAKQTDIYKNTMNEYVAIEEEYKDLEDFYGLYTYDADHNRIKVEDADTTAFDNDLRVKTIILTARYDRINLTNINIVSFAISYVISTLIVYLLPPLFSKKHYTLGALAFNIVISKNNQLVNKKEYYKYSPIYLISHLYLGLGIFNLIDFIYLIISKEKKSLLEKIFKYDVAIDFDKVESEILTEEKMFEDEHSHIDQSPKDIIKF